MFHRRVRCVANLQEMIMPDCNGNLIRTTKLNQLSALFSTGSTCVELPRKLKRSEGKPLVTGINELKRRARFEKEERLVVREAKLRPPENGLLVKNLVPVAREVLASRAQLFAYVSRVAADIHIYLCSLCGEVHVGHQPHKIKTCNVAGSPANKEHVWKRGSTQDILPVVECFHMYDRLGRAVSHNERLQVDRIPAIVELCVQAGVDMPEHPTRRREFPVYRIAGKMIDFERRFPKDNLSLKNFNPYGFWESKKNGCTKSIEMSCDDVKGYAEQGMEALEKMRSGAIKLMEKYAVQTCGYCPEVQVGPKGHRVRQCQAFKHQMRDGQHAWQEATVDDLVPPVYVWHVQNPQGGGLLIDGLRRYYGKLPAVVELFAQAGARVGENYCGVMREDVAVPELDEEKLAV